MNESPQSSTLARLASWLLYLVEIKLGDGPPLSFYW